MFVVDGSTSVGCQNFHKQLQFLVDFVRRLEIGPGSNQTRVGVIQFSSRVYPHFYMKTYDNKNEMINAIKKIDWSRGSTKTYAALDFVRKYSFKTSAGDRPNVPNVVIVLTDGRSSSSSLTGRAAAKLKNVPGTTVIAIGIARADKNEVRRIATGTGDDNCFLLATFDILSGILKNLEEKTCSASSGMM